MVEIYSTRVSPSESSFIRGMTYIPEQGGTVRNEQLLEVRIKHDDQGEMPYYYESVPKSTYIKFRNADSFGSFYHTYLRDGSFDRDYTDSLTEQTEEMANMLYDVPTSISGHIKNQHEEFYTENMELVDCLSQRRFDKSVLYVQDNPKFIGYTFEILYLLVQKIITKLQTEYNTDLSEKYKEKLDTYTTEMQTYISIHNM